MAKLLKHLGLGNEKPNLELSKPTEEVGHGRYRRIDSNALFEIESNGSSQRQRVKKSTCSLNRDYVANSAKSWTDSTKTEGCADFQQHSRSRHNFQLRKSNEFAGKQAKQTSVKFTDTEMLPKKVVLLDDYSDPVDVIRSSVSQSEIYSDPSDYQYPSRLQSQNEAVYDVPPDDDYTDPYESGITDAIKTQSENYSKEEPEEALKAFSFLEEESSSVIYDVPPNVHDDDAIIYDTPPAENSDTVVYDMPWEWTTGAHLRTNLSITGDRSSLSSHDSSGSQNSVGSAGSSSSSGRRRLVYETTFDSVVKSRLDEDNDKRIQNQTRSIHDFGSLKDKNYEKHSNKVLVNIAPNNEKKVTLVREQVKNLKKPTTHDIIETKATIEFNNSLDIRHTKIKKPKHHSFSDFDQLRRKVNMGVNKSNVQNENPESSNHAEQKSFDVSKELKGMTDMIIKTASVSTELKDNQSVPSTSNSNQDYELPWDYNQAETNFKKLAFDINKICDKPINAVNKKINQGLESDSCSYPEYDEPWDLNAVHSKLKIKGYNFNKLPIVNKHSNEASSGQIDTINANSYVKMKSESHEALSSSLPTKLKSDPIIPTNIASADINTDEQNFTKVSSSSCDTNMGAFPKNSKDSSCPPIMKPKMTLDFSQPSRRPRQNLNLNFGCSALNAIGEKIDTSLPLEQQGWYHGSITRVDAENQLRVLKEGSYLVRNSESCKQDFSLSLKSAKGFMHMKIVNKNNKFILGQFSKPFNNIPEMIQHYSMNKLPIRGAEHMSLLFPVIDQLL